MIGAGILMFAPIQSWADDGDPIARWSPIEDALIQTANAQIDPGLAPALVQTVGIGMDHRAFEPATPLGIFLGLDIGVSVALVKPPSSLGSALSATFVSLTGSSPDFSSMTQDAIPSIRFQIHKGLGNWVDLGFSALPSLSSIPVLGGSRLYGADLKICFWRPEEGPTLAFRVSYSLNYFSFRSVDVSTSTWTPALLMSKNFGSFEPYLGLSFQYATGLMNISIDSSALNSSFSGLASLPSISLSQSATSTAGNLFGGLSMRVPLIGLNLTLEGAYNTAYLTYVGTKIGLRF